MRAALRRIPVPLLFAQLAGVFVQVVVLLLVLLAPDADRKSAAGFLLKGSSYAIPALSMVGLAWLGRGLTGAGRIGARIAMVATATGLVLLFAWSAVLIFLFATQQDFPPSLLNVHSAVDSICAVAVGVGLAISTRRWFWIPIAALVAVVAHPMWFVWEWLPEGLSWGEISLISQAFLLLEGLMQIGMAAVASRHATPMEEPAPVARGLARGGLALRGVAIALAVLAAVTVLPDTYDVDGSVLLLIAVVATFHVACLFALGFGMLSTIRGRDGLPAWPVVSSAAVALAVAGMLAMREISLLRFLDPTRSPSLGGIVMWAQGRRLVPAASVVLLVALSIGALVVAVAIAARRRGLEELRARAITITCVVVGLAIAAVTGQTVIADAVEVTPLSATIIVATNAALVAAWLLAARILRRAAGELGGGGGYLPTATLIR
jgi:hypothetical protein